MSIAIFNPSIASTNLGDEIIADAVRQELSIIFPFEQVINIPTQEKIGKISIGHSIRATQRILGGTNILSSHMLKYKQWQINILQTILLKDVTLMGVGWWQYQNRPDLYTRAVLSRVLSSKKIHSVRDEYTKTKLNSIGIRNVLNTGCQTMWQLTSEHCAAIPQAKASKVIFTLTDYNQSIDNDKALISLLNKNYKQVLFWPQGAGDLSYLKLLGTEGLKIIDPSLDAYDKVLNQDGLVDFIGTRLHGGVRALQMKRRSLILAVDNRAREIGLDTGLNVIDRSDLNAIEAWIVAAAPTKIKMNWENINEWKNQFLLASA